MEYKTTVSPTTRKFRQLAKEVFNTPKGMELLALLKAEYVDTTAFKQTVEMTYAALANKELIQSLVQLVNDPDQLDEMIVNYNPETVGEDIHDGRN